MGRAKMSRQMLGLAQGRLDQIAAANPGDGQKLATTAAILLDKSVMLETGEAEDRKAAEIDERMAELFSEGWSCEIRPQQRGGRRCR